MSFRKGNIRVVKLSSGIAFQIPTLTMKVIELGFYVTMFCQAQNINRKNAIQPVTWNCDLDKVFNLRYVPG